MEIIGKWKIAEAEVYNKDFTKTWKTEAEIMADDSLEEHVKQSLSFRYLFNEDGTVYVLFPIPADAPKDEIEAAIASGELKLHGDNEMVLEEKEWKLENGRLMFNSGAKAEVFGEEISPWVGIKETPSGIELMSFRLVRE